MKKIYIGCSLTHAPQDFKQAIQTLKDSLRETYQILDFVGLINGTPQEVFEWDTNCVKTCDLFVADCTYPAIGLGYELGVAVEQGKHILAVAHQDAIVSRLVLGISSPNYFFHRYTKMSEVKVLIKELL